MSDQFTCPHCDAEVPFDANVCPECGSDEHTGWSEEAEYTHLLPYDEEADSADSASGRWGPSLNPTNAPVVAPTPGRIPINVPIDADRRSNPLSL